MIVGKVKRFIRIYRPHTVDAHPIASLDNPLPLAANLAVIFRVDSHDIGP